MAYRDISREELEERFRQALIETDAEAMSATIPGVADPGLRAGHQYLHMRVGGPDHTDGNLMLQRPFPWEYKEETVEEEEPQPVRLLEVD